MKSMSPILLFAVICLAFQSDATECDVQPYNDAWKVRVIISTGPGYSRELSVMSSVLPTCFLFVAVACVFRRCSHYPMRTYGTSRMAPLTAAWLWLGNHWAKVQRLSSTLQPTILRRIPPSKMHFIIFRYTFLWFRDVRTETRSITHKPLFQSQPHAHFR